MVWLAALAAAATVSACATSPAATPAATPAAVAKPAPMPSAPAATAAATKPMTAPAAFAICGACHGTTANAPPGLGPNLHGVVGRKAGSLADYDYSDAMKASGKVWTVDALTAFVTDPSKAVPGNKMDYDGTDAATAKTVAEYMTSLK
jgi:cytochrome c2